MNLQGRGRLWPLMFLTAVLALIVACMGAQGDTATPADEPGAAQRIDGGDMVVQGNEPDSLDPHWSAFQPDISLERMLWRGLYWLDENQEVQPSMAAAMPVVSADGTIYTITLRDSLLWSDGDDLTAEDFVLGIERTCNPDNAGQYQFALTSIVGCDDYAYAAEPTDEEKAELRAAVGVAALDDTTVEITLANPQPTFTIVLSLWMTFPVPAHLLPEPGEAWPAGPDAPDALAFNGPYMLTEYVPQDHATLAANPNWAAPNGVSPTLDSLTVRFIDDTASANNAYRTDELHFALADTTVLSTLVSEFGDGDEYFQSVRPSTRGLQMNLGREPLDNVDVRLALSQAIDRQALVEVVASGAHQATTSWIPGFVPAGAAPDAFNACCGFDPDAARQHLADAGYPDGEGFPEGLSLLIGDSPEAQDTAAFLQDAFKTHLNINIEIEAVDGATRADRFYSIDYDLYIGGWAQDYHDPETWVVGLFETGSFINFTNCSNEEIDQLIADNLSNTDNAARLAAYARVNELIVTTVCGVAPFWHENSHYLIKPNVVGMSENAGAQDAIQAGDWLAEAWGFSE